MVFIHERKRNESVFTSDMYKREENQKKRTLFGGIKGYNISQS